MKDKILFILFISILIFNLPVYSAVKGKIKLTALNSMQRIGLSDKPCGADKVGIKAAKNEVESFQVVVIALDENIKVISAEISDLIGEYGEIIGRGNIKLFREEYVRIRRSTPRAELPPGLYADPLVPFINPITRKSIEPLKRIQKKWGEPTITVGHEMYAVPFEVFKGQNQPIWVDVHVPKYAYDGIYKGKFTVKAEGGISAEIPVTLTVWDFTLPDDFTHKNRIEFFGFRNIPRYFDLKEDSEKFNKLATHSPPTISKRFKKIEMNFCEAMAEHRLSPPVPGWLLPEVNDDGSLNIIPERHFKLKKFINDFHVTVFLIPRAPSIDERFEFPRPTLRPDYKYISPSDREKAIRYYRDYYHYIKENGWENIAYVYLHDEPNLRENYEQVIVFGELVHEAVPELKRIVGEQPFPQDPTWPDIDPVTDVYYPLWSFIERKSIDEKIAQGDEVWSYTALVQRAPRMHPRYEYVKDFDPPYWHIDRTLCHYRVPTWVNRQYNLTGILYWSVITGVKEPWFNPTIIREQHFNGGGYLFYPGVPCGIDGAVSSIRVKNLRDGMEDYEYFTILEKLAGEEAVMKIVNTIAPNWWDFSKNPDDFYEAREKLAEEILKANR